MQQKVIAYDLGTSGIKASLYDCEGRNRANTLWTYETVYTGKKFHEQNPMQWWEGICRTTQSLLAAAHIDADEVSAVAISGHSLGAVPVSSDGEILTELTPIWSDLRAGAQADAFFEKVDYDAWYNTTGNGFPRECYSVFKMMWLRDHFPEKYRKTEKFMGSKDLCNFLFTGRKCTDSSYASGSGVFDLAAMGYQPNYIAASGIDVAKFPEIIASDAIVGEVTAWAAEQTGLRTGTKVICGGVDNSCMALGARGIQEGRVYMSLGSSAWIAAISAKPILDSRYKPFVFAHVLPGMYASATSIFAAGTSMKWARNELCGDLVQAEREGRLKDAYVQMNEMAEQSRIGAGQLLFNPCLTGGSMIEEDPNIAAGFIGLNTSHTRNDMIRAVFEGVCYNLRYALEILRKYEPGIDEMLLVGGGSKSPMWRQMFADVMQLDTIKTSIDQDAASLGAAALAMKGIGVWQDYTRIDELHVVEGRCKPDLNRTAEYDIMYKAHRMTAHYLSEIGKNFTKMFGD